ncbi:hypothetical protein D9M71_836390 [compost metagenome]
MPLDAANLLHYFFYALIGSSLVAEEDIAVGMGNFVTHINQFLKLSDMLVLTASQAQKLEDAALVNLTKRERRARLQESRLLLFLHEDN